MVKALPNPTHLSTFTPHLLTSRVKPETDFTKVYCFFFQCNDVQCVFEKSGFLTNTNTLNKVAYRAHLKKWSENHSGWSEAVDKAIADCVDKELRQYLDYSCKAYDVFTCTGIAMLKVNYLI